MNKEQQIIQDHWQDILDFIRREYDISDISYKTWLLELKIESLEDSVLLLVYPHISGVDFIQKKYSIFIQVAIEEVTGIRCEVKITTPEESVKKTSKPPVETLGINLNPRYTFDTFVVGNNNKLAHAASLAVAESPGMGYNPLFIYGGAGLGKTHLMQSIAHFILKKNPKAKVVYVTSEQFTSELVDAIRQQKNMEFRAKYRNVDILLIDDIQFIINKESTQQEVFHTFNTLFEANKAIVLTSDRPPKDLETLEERLRSRFGSGLTVDIGLPDFETRMAILRKKEELEGYNIDNEVIQYIATNIVSNIRDLEGALNKVTALSRLGNHREINLELAKEALKDHITTNGKREITPEYIMEVVADHFGIKETAMISQSRRKEVVQIRYICMLLMREMTPISLKGIATILKKDDHTTISHGIERLEQEMEKDENLRNIVDIIRKKLSSTT